MKISASIYSDKKRSLQETILDLQNHHVDLLHVDCNDDLTVFEDIKKIRQWTKIPIDLHIITSSPSKYYDLLLENPVEYLTFQFENLKERLEIPQNFIGKKGLAIITPTEIEVFDAYSDFDFILIMATIPGQSGGVFDEINFTKIRQFKKKYPNKSIHVDGGVNAEVSFILRNMGVSSSVSGSYLFNSASVGNALMNLTNRAIDSHYRIKDFMIPLEESPYILEKDLSFLEVLKTIDAGNSGFTLVIDESKKLKGIISNADVRRGLIQQFTNLPKINVFDLLNKNAVRINQNQTVFEMLQLIKKSSFPIMYLPVINDLNEAVGIVTFLNLIKGEI
jgi:ribulose-phosphate 3-epimerase